VIGCRYLQLFIEYKSNEDQNCYKVETPKTATFWSMGTLKGSIVISVYRNLKGIVEQEQICN